mmetsp:Transcript_20422/g.39113  ORF Transcript_20422/g.39113 Transcript_20422/m.39113 type:complete len:211 (+) Transcript_20422:466-1098(+)
MGRLKADAVARWGCGQHFDSFYIWPSSPAKSTPGCCLSCLRSFLSVKSLSRSDVESGVSTALTTEHALSYNHPCHLPIVHVSELPYPLAWSYSPARCARPPRSVRNSGAATQSVLVGLSHKLGHHHAGQHPNGVVFPLSAPLSSNKSVAACGPLNIFRQVFTRAVDLSGVARSLFEILTTGSPVRDERCVYLSMHVHGVSAILYSGLYTY